MKKTTLVLALAATTLLSGCNPYSVDEGEIGLITKYGEIVETATAGLGWKTWIEDVTYFSTREQRVTIGGYDNSGDVSGGLSAYTKDVQTVTTALTVTFKITDIEQIYKNYRTTDNMVSQLIEPRARQAIELVFSTYSANEAIANRAKLSADITAAVREAVKGYPIEITAVQSVIQFGKDYEKRAEQSAQNDVELRNKERELLIQKKQAEIVTTNAQAKADAEIIQAKADAEKVKLAGEAEAAAIRAKGEALKENKQLVDLTAAEKWNGVLPTTMTPNGAVPFIKVGGQ